MTFRSSRILAAAALFTGVVSLATPSFASTIATFGSYAGTAPAGLSNSTITYDNTNVATAPLNTGLATTGNVSVFNPGYSNTLTGTTWVSYDPNTGTKGDNGGLTVYKTTYTGTLAGATGTLSILADDTVNAYLNGVFIGTTAPSTYDTLKTFTIADGIYKNGVNVFEFDVINANGQTTPGGPTGFDFKATAVTPEPSTLLMLGTGVLSAAGMVRRRIVG